MNIIVGLLIAVILSSISCIHIYWLSGGRWGILGAIPTKDGKPLFGPKPGATLFVASALLVAAFLVLGRIGFLVDQLFPSSIYNYGIWGMTAIFFLRAIGDFNYVGFFKKVKDSKFAYWDTRFHSPLCLLISVSSLFINLTTA